MHEWPRSVQHDYKDTEMYHIIEPFTYQTLPEVNTILVQSQVIRIVVKQ